MARGLNNLGEALNVLGQHVEAQCSFLDALQTAFDVQVMPVALDALMGLATLRSKEGATEPVLEWLAHILQHPATSHETKDRAEKLRPDLESRLTPQQLEVVQARAQARSFTAVVQEILDTVATP